MSEQQSQPQAPARSGYARLRSRHHALIAKHEAVKGECQAWRAMYLELKERLDPLIDAVAPRSGHG
jgi:hypothetical protein